MKADEPKLERVDLSDVALPNHQRRLRRALLDSGCFKESPTMKILKIASPIGGAIAVAAVIAAILLSSSGTTSASPQQVVQKTTKAVASLSTDQKSALTLQLGLGAGTTLDGLLKQALNARDLVVLDYAECAKQYPWIMPPHSDGKTPDVTCFKFTGDNNATYVIGVNNQTGLPTMAATANRNANGNGVSSSGIWKVDPSTGTNATMLPRGGGGGSSGGSSVSVQGNSIYIDGKQFPLPAGVDPSHVSVQYKKGKVYVNGQEIQQQ